MDKAEERAQNIIILLFIFLLSIALYRHYEIGRDLRRLCELLGPHESTYTRPLSTKEEIDQICLDHDPDEYQPDD
jgi:hypothetical protein